MDKPVEREAKKPYSPPTLVLYGTVRQLTQHVGTHGQTDRPPRTPTHNKTNF
jgi:hypothetical protein